MYMYSRYNNFALQLSEIILYMCMCVITYAPSPTKSTEFLI